MAVTQSRDNRTLIAAADLSSSQFLFAAMDAAGKAVNSASGDIILGRAYEAGVTDQLIAIELVSTGNAHA